MKILALDTETGGVDIEHSLLTVYFEVVDEAFNTLGSLDLAIKADPYIVSASGLDINKIDLVKHDAVAIPKSKAGQQLRDFLISHSEKGADKLIPLGHGVAFDLQHVWRNLLNRKEFEQYVSYRRLDTACNAQFQKLTGELPEAVTGSLDSLREHYGIAMDGNLHDAKADTRLTIQVLKRQLGRPA